VSRALSQQAPEFLDGAEAAAAAITKSCELGRPLQVIACDDQWSPNQAAVCARKAVTEKAVADVTYSGFGDSIVPILAAAKIPAMGQQTSSEESTNPYSFPIAYPIPQLLGEVSTVAALGAKSLVVASVDIPAVKFLTGVIAAQAKAVGIKALPSIAVPPTQTDMGSYAGQVLGSKADAVMMVLGGPQESGLAKALREQGATFGTDTGSLIYSSGMNVLTPSFVKDLDPEGMTASAWTWVPTDTSGPGIKQYIDELKAAGKPSGPLDADVLGMTGWAGVHVIADTLKGQSEMTAATLVERLKAGAATPFFEKYGLPPTDYTKPAFSSGPLSKLRVFSRHTSAWVFDESGQPKPLSSTWFDVTKPPKLDRLDRGS
jgi:ABC-type branched-subunit amino acid transport system substrate-binding protein